MNRPTKTQISYPDAVANLILAIEAVRPIRK